MAEDFVKLRFPNSPALSPDGTKLAFSIKSVNHKKNSYRSPIYLKEKDREGYRQFTTGTYVDTSARFSPSGEYLAFLSSRLKKKLQVYAMRVYGGEAFPVTKFPSGVIDFAWSHDSKSIHVIALINEEELQEILESKEEDIPSFVLNPNEFDAYRASKKRLKKLKADPRVISEAYCRKDIIYLEGRFAQPFVIPVVLPTDSRNNKNQKLLHLGDFGYHYTLGAFSSDDKFIYLSKYKDDPAISLELEIQEISISNPKEKRSLGSIFGWPANFHVSPNGKYLSFEGIRETIGIYDNTQIFIIDLEQNTKDEFTSVTESLDRSVSQSQWVDNQSLLFLATKDGRIGIYRVNIEIKTIDEVLGGDRNINAFSFARNGDRIAYEVSHNTFPGDIFWCKGDGTNEERVTEANKKFLESHIPATVQAFHYQRDELDFQGWILLPPMHHGSDKLPVVLEIHGGPSAMWTPHEKTLWHEWNVLVSKGYAVVFCNPRGSDGYGIEFRSGVFKNWGESPGNDILKGLDIALDRYMCLDSNRIVVTGGSYGGYMTAWLATHSNRFKAAISQRGVYEFFSFGLTTDIPIWLEKQFDCDLIDQHEILWMEAPLKSIKNLEIPLLIIHSENDFRVPVVTAEQLFWAAKRYGKTVQFVRYPRDGHELSRSGEPRHIIDRINRIEQWVTQYI